MLEECPSTGTSSCISVTPTEYGVNVKCKNNPNDIKIIYSGTKQKWINNINSNEYNTVQEAIIDYCKVLPQEKCPDVSSCISVDPTDISGKYLIKCKYSSDNYLTYSNDSHDWRWFNSTPTGRMNYDTMENAIKTECENIPEVKCPGVSSCISVEDSGSKNQPKFIVKCKYRNDQNILYDPVEKKWYTSLYGVSRMFTNTDDVIKELCPAIPQVKCPDVSSCETVTETGLNKYLLKCKYSEDDLYLAGDGRWRLSSTNTSYNSSDEAIKYLCKPVSGPKCPSSDVSSCISISKDTVQPSTVSTMFTLNCKNTLRDNRVLYRSSTDKWEFLENFKTYNTIEDGIKEVCPFVP